MNIFDSKDTYLNLVAQANAASSLRRWVDATSLWRQVVASYGDSTEAIIGLGVALREQKLFKEANTVLEAGLERYPAVASIDIAHAWVAMGERDWTEAAKRWSRICSLHPNNPAGHIGYSSALRELQQFDEAEVILRDAITRLPTNFELLIEYGLLAANRQDWPASLLRYESAALHLPEDPRPIVGIALALRELGRLDEAEALLRSALAKFPHSTELALSEAWVSIQRRDWSTALTRWDKIIGRYPEAVEGYVGLGIALRESKMFSLAERLLADARSRFPRHAQLAAEYGWVSIASRDWAIAKDRWAKLSIEFPDSARIQSDYGYVLLSCGEPDQARHLLYQTCRRFPRHLGSQIYYGLTLNALGDWSQAVSFWNNLSTTHPSNRRVRDGLGAAKFGLSMSFVDNIDTEVLAKDFDQTSTSPGDLKEIADMDLVKLFESLGENCEFGLLQRAVGAEPLGLLRFAGITPGKLAAALDCDFDGVGAKENTTLRDSSGEYVTSDTRFGMTMHTFIQTADAPSDKVYPTMLKKLVFLRRKLLEDLESGEKIFVYKVWGSLSTSELADLRRALARYKKAILFVVAVAEHAELPGSVHLVDETLVRGYIDRHGYRQGRWEIPVEAWLHLCRQAYQLIQAKRRAGV